MVQWRVGYTLTSLKRHSLAIAGILAGLSLPLAGLAQQGVVPHLTRAEGSALLLLTRTLNLPDIPNEGKFRDIGRGQWYEQPMLVAEKYGIITADATTQELRPNEYVNRAEFVRMLSLTFGLSADGAKPHYLDVKPDAWYFSDAAIAQKYTLFPGELDLLDFSAEKLITHSEAVAAVEAALKIRPAEKASPDDLVARDADIGPIHLSLLFSRVTQRLIQLQENIDEVPDAPALNPTDISQMRTTLLSLVNQRRVQGGLDPLRYEAKLADSAQKYAEEMADKEFFSHTSPSGETLKDRMLKSGYYNRTFSVECLCVKGYTLGENLARGPRTPQQAFDAWMNSPHHRDAILNNDYTDTGFGIKDGYWVEHFGGIILPTETVIEVSGD